MIQRQSASHGGHLDLLAELGVGELGWHFAPFERGFLDGVDPGGPVRRWIQGRISGRIEGVEGDAGAVLAVALGEGWRVRALGRGALVEAREGDLLLSLEPEEGGFSLGGRSHLAPEATGAHLGELVACFDDLGWVYDLGLETLEGRRLGEWLSG